jgi:hypothetical protein
MAFEKSSTGPPKGRRLLADFDEFGLKAGDRLEPTHDMPDVAAFDSRLTPFTATFWRSSLDTLTRRRNPLFRKGTGLSIESLGIDVLHLLSLGVYQVFLGRFFWDIIILDLFRFKCNLEARQDRTMARLREMLFAWYLSEERAGRQHARVNQFFTNTFGSHSKRAFRVQGAATNGLLAFARYLLDKIGHGFGDRLQLYRKGLDALLSIGQSMKDHPRKYPPQAVQHFVDDVGRYVAASKALGVPEKPKLHLLFDLAARTF